MNHTPTPWTAEYGENSGYDCMTAAFIIYGPGRRIIAIVDLRSYGQENCVAPSAEMIMRAQADANLIVAAPDLLAIVRLIRSSYDPYDQMITSNDLSAIDAVIALADGVPNGQ